MKAIIDTLVQDFCYSIVSHSRNGGLIGLAATAIALGPIKIVDYLNEIIPPVLTCLTDQDPRVRYYACESMYNICKVSRAHCLIFFNEIFDSLSKLAADPELSVKNGADLLDQQLKDIVVEHHHPDFSSSNSQTPISFSLPSFIPMLADRIHTLNVATRLFLISWIVTLQGIPDINIIKWVPDFIDGLLNMLSDQQDVRSAAMRVLIDLLNDIDKDLSSVGSLSENTPDELSVNLANPTDSTPYVKILPILLPHTRPFSPKVTRKLALMWIEMCIRKDENR